MMRRVVAFVVLALAVAGFLALRATRPVPEPIEPRERVWRIETLTAEPATVRPTLVLYGRIEAPDRVRAAAPVSGRILEVAVRDGDRVAEGQVLARMDARDLEPRLRQARADMERERIRLRHDREALAHERTLLELSRTKLARFEKLQSARLGAEATADQVREEVARNQLAVTMREQAIAEHPARLAQAQARLAEAERDAARGEIVAPFTARIGTVEVAAGDQVQAGQVLLALYPSDTLYLRAKLPAIYAEELRSALAAGDAPTASADFGASRLTARLERIGGEADARGVDVLLRLMSPGNVPVGAFVNAVLERPAVADVFELPFSALHGGERVYEVRDGRLKGRAVQRIGERRNGDDTRLVARVPGLVAGARIMITHLPNAIDGLAVEALP